ncbi:hypothetical protein WG922_15840 [Ramlibacter sp. AN1015]|uniref:hypothetical protein n=1 Tax=Ramlibacter sp. AN1015 TaxID=3133428 RepID=UPI0030C51858
MRRWLLLLLAFVLPLQMSWAAVHACHDELATATAHAQAPGSDRAIALDVSNVEIEDGKQFSDACCGAAHACHGLHHLMGHAAPEFTAQVSSQINLTSGPAPALIQLSARVERPKWLAA